MGEESFINEGHSLLSFLDQLGGIPNNQLARVNDILVGLGFDTIGKITDTQPSVEQLIEWGIDENIANALFTLVESTVYMIRKQNRCHEMDNVPINNTGTKKGKEDDRVYVGWEALSKR